MQNEPITEKSSWLSELESKSWSLEMTISGVATYAVSFLPGIIDRGLDYYLEHWSPTQSKIAVMLPILSYSFFMVVAWVLIAFFVAHLCVRALWVSTVGLHSAFPAGIQYSKLPQVSEVYKKMAEARYGTLEQFIFRLDKRSNKMFALAFMLALGLGGIGILYLFAFCFLMLLRTSLEPETLKALMLTLYFLFVLLAIGLLVANWWFKRNPNQAKMGKFTAKLQMAFGGISNPLFARTLQYLTLTFLSNVSRKEYFKWTFMIILFMIMSTIFVTVKKSQQMAAKTLSFERAFFSSGTAQYKLSNNAYDDLRPPESPLPNVCIPSNIVQKPFLPVFVKYPRYLDERLSKFCGEIQVSSEDFPSKKDRIQQLDSLKIDCLSRYFELSINDSIYQKLEWMFTEKAGSKGLVTYLDSRAFPFGKNMLYIKIPSENKADSLEAYGELKFWYSPENQR